MSLSAQIAVGFALGVATGLFFGEDVGFLEVLGDAFIKLLQMTVLPYVVISLIAGLGRLSMRQARALALRVGTILLCLWGVTLALLAVMPLAFPEWKTANFFSTSIAHAPAQIDLLNLYIPSNPFRSMAEGVVPAVVLFSIALGVALIGMEGGQRLVDALGVLGDALTRIASFVVRLTPIGVFAITASAAGTMTVEEFEKVQVFLVCYVAFTLLLSFWILPGLVTILTPLRYREVMSVSRDALFTAFATSSLFVVLPMLAEGCKQLLEKHRLTAADEISEVDVVVPVSYSFPHVAKVLTISFILFAGWYSDSPVEFGEYPKLFTTGLVTLFGSVNVAVPFMLDLMRIPSDMYQLFVATSVVNSRFGTLLSAVHVLVLTLLGTCAMAGALRVQWVRLLRFSLASLALTGILVVGINRGFERFVDTTYEKDQLVTGLRLLVEPVPTVVHETSPDPEVPPTPGGALGGSRIEQIRQRGALRACYLPNLLPLAYTNSKGELVGYSVELAHRLARSLGVGVEFFPLYNPAQSIALLRSHCDLQISAAVSVGLAHPGKLQFSQPYLDLTLALIVEDHRRREFRDRHAVSEREGLRIGAPTDYYAQRAQHYFPKAEVIRVAPAAQFDDDTAIELDALLHSAEIGAAWSLLHPEYTVVVPQPPLEAVPMAFSFSPDAGDLPELLDNWITVKRADGTLQALYDHWILGKDSEAQGPRWSVLRDVLGRE
ncbi:MAG: cation:dicarboxylate symporter family transporter [Myxococcota bacterium]